MTPARYAAVIAVLYAADYLLTAWALSSLPHVAEANPLWPYAPILTSLAVFVLSIIAVKYWQVRAIRYGLYAALAIAMARVLWNIAVVLLIVYKTSPLC